MALIKACEEPAVTGDKFRWELSYKNEGAVQSQLLPDGIEGLKWRSGEDGWREKDISTCLSPSLPRRAVMIAGLACLFIESFHSWADWLGAFKQT